MKSNPDDRRDNVDRIQFNINHTIENMEQADEIMALSDDPRQIKALKEKNARRQDALDSLKNEIKDEADAKKQRYK